MNVSNQPTPTGKSTPRVLVVDDNISQLKALCDTLIEQGYEVVGSDNGSAALNVLRRKSFDLVLADLMMPQMDGIELLRQAFEIRHDLVGVIMTGEGTIPTAVESLKIGALDYLLKPFNTRDLLSVITRALVVKQLRLEKEDLEKRLAARSAELEESNKRLAMANDELGAYSYSIAHDLKAPLRALDRVAECLATKFQTQLPPEAIESVVKIREGAQRMHLLVDALLSFSALSWVPLTRMSVQPDLIVKQVMEELRPLWERRPVEFHLEKLPVCSADPALMRQVFTNLLSNAVKYSRDKAPAVINLGCRRKGNEHVYFVQDNGAGFDMNSADRLFRIFQRLHTKDQFEGNGAGLAIVHRIIQRHGGRIWAEAKVGQGATFQFTLGAEEV